MSCFRSGGQEKTGQFQVQVQKNPAISFKTRMTPTLYSIFTLESILFWRIPDTCILR